LPQLAAKTSYVYASAYADNPMLYPHRVPFGTSWIIWFLMKFPFFVRYLPSRPPPTTGPAPVASSNKSAAAGGQYLMILPGKLSTKLPVFIPQASMGGYVRCLVEDEPAGTNLLAVDWWVDLNEGMRTWEKVTGRKARFVEVTVSLLCRMTGMKEESVESGAFLAEYPYMCDVQDWIEPSGLKNPPAPPIASFEEYLRSRGSQELLA
jgi:hypothetical protein